MIAFISSNTRSTNDKIGECIILPILSVSITKFTFSLLRAENFFSSLRFLFALVEITVKIYS